MSLSIFLLTNSNNLSHFFLLTWSRNISFDHPSSKAGILKQGSLFCWGCREKLGGEIQCQEGPRDSSVISDHYAVPSAGAELRHFDSNSPSTPVGIGFIPLTFASCRNKGRIVLRPDLSTATWTCPTSFPILSLSNLLAQNRKKVGITYLMS